jgi:hypothetical protein
VSRWTGQRLVGRTRVGADPSQKVVSEHRRGKRRRNGGKQVKIGSQKDMQMRPFGIDAVKSAITRWRAKAINSSAHTLPGCAPAPRKKAYSQKVRMDTRRGMHVHLLHLVAVQLVLDLLSELRRQPVACRWLASPIVFARVEGMVYCAFRRPDQVLPGAKRRRGRAGWFARLPCKV